MIVGKKYTAKDTESVKNNGLEPGEQGYVTFVDDSAISLEFTRIDRELKVLRPSFGLNFSQSSLAETGNPAYQKDKHATEMFK